MLRDFIDQYQENRITATKWDKSPTSKFRSFINSLLIDMLVFIAAILTALVATMVLQRLRVIDTLHTNKQTQNCNSELLKILIILNLVKVVSLLLRKMRKSVFFQGQLFQHGKDKIISGRYKVLCFIRSKLNSWEYTFFQIDRRTVIREYYLKEKLDMGCVRN